MSLENDIPRLEKGDAVSNGHVLQLDLVIFATKAFNMPSLGFRKGVPCSRGEYFRDRALEFFCILLRSV